MTESNPKDKWTQWLLERRHGGDEALHRRMLAWLEPMRDKVLEHASLAGDETLLDVGCGDGLIGFGALNSLPDGKVIFSDISQDLLTHTQALAAEMGVDVSARCDFVQADAATLEPFGDASVDVVTTRSVLIYVKDKRAAFESFYRVLKQGGTFSLFEPINSFGHPQPPHLFYGFDASPVQELAEKVKAIYQAIQPDDDPMLDFDERDLIRFAEEAGFREVNLELVASITPFRASEMPDWDSMLNTAPNPLVPTLREAVQQALTADEQPRFLNYMRKQVEAGNGQSRRAVAYLWGEK
ncbi:MAG: class I SAM-dependent methyltransferase [Aggregatilineales bacterium]